MMLMENAFQNVDYFYLFEEWIFYLSFCASLIEPYWKNIFWKQRLKVKHLLKQQFFVN